MSDKITHNNNNLYNKLETISNHELDDQIGIPKISLIAFYKEDHQDEIILFKNQILSCSFDKYPKEIKRNRNILIYLTFIQILIGLLSMFYIIFRRSFIYLVINFIELSLGFCGFFCSVKLNKTLFLFQLIF